MSEREVQAVIDDIATIMDCDREEAEGLIATAVEEMEEAVTGRVTKIAIMPAMIPVITITTISSSKVKPPCLAACLSVEREVMATHSARNARDSHQA